MTTDFKNRMVMVLSTFACGTYLVWRACYGFDKISKKLIDTPDVNNFVQSVKLLLFAYIGVFWLIGFCCAYFMFYPFKTKKNSQKELTDLGMTSSLNSIVCFIIFSVMLLVAVSTLWLGLKTEIHSIHMLGIFILGFSQSCMILSIPKSQRSRDLSRPESVLTYTMLILFVYPVIVTIPFSDSDKLATCLNALGSPVSLAAWFLVELCISATLWNSIRREPDKPN